MLECVDNQPVMRGWSEGPDPESRASGFASSTRPGMTRIPPRLPPCCHPCHDGDCPRIRKPMRFFSVPVSVPFLRSVIAALIDGRLVDGFEARTDPSRLAQATL